MRKCIKCGALEPEANAAEAVAAPNVERHALVKRLRNYAISEFWRDTLGPGCHSTIVEAADALESAGAAPDVDLTVIPNSQQWAGMSGDIAYQLIERHANNWSDARLMMEEWHRANMPEVAAPSGWVMDAQRYRWLRDDDDDSDIAVVDLSLPFGTRVLVGGALDAAVDAAIEPPDGRWRE